MNSIEITTMIAPEISGDEEYKVTINEKTVVVSDSEGSVLLTHAQMDKLISFYVKLKQAASIVGAA